MGAVVVYVPGAGECGESPRDVGAEDVYRDAACRPSEAQLRNAAYRKWLEVMHDQGYGTSTRAPGGGRNISLAKWEIAELLSQYRFCTGAKGALAMLRVAVVVSSSMKAPTKWVFKVDPDGRAVHVHLRFEQHGLLVNRVRVDVSHCARVSDCVLAVGVSRYLNALLRAGPAKSVQQLFMLTEFYASALASRPYVPCPASLVFGPFLLCCRCAAACVKNLMLRRCLTWSRARTTCPARCGRRSAGVWTTSCPRKVKCTTDC